MTARELIRQLLSLPPEALDQEVFYNTFTEYGPSTTIIDGVSQQEYMTWDCKEYKIGVELG